jgi:phosphomannomutase
LEKEKMKRGKLSCFKEYDIRGIVPEEFNADLCYEIGRSVPEVFPVYEAVIGGDARPSSGELSEALSRGLRDGGANVTDIGLCGTEEVYFATAAKCFDVGIMVTASHNPKGYNGLKLIGRGAVPIIRETGLDALHNRVREGRFSPVSRSRRCDLQNYRREYVRFLCHLSGFERFRDFRVVGNAGNGCAARVFRELCEYLPITHFRLNEVPDGNFPNGVPRLETFREVIARRADFGVAWDGDFDRCLFFDERGDFVESYYMVGLFAERFLKKYPGSTILYDPRLYWNTEDLVVALGGHLRESSPGHAFMKQGMQKRGAVYGGESSGHHYFRQFFNCDSGMLPWLILLDILASEKKSLSELLAPRIAAFPCSGEVNRPLQSDEAAREVTERIVRHFHKEHMKLSLNASGLSWKAAAWRCNLRTSNTEPLIRLNVESRGDVSLMKEKTEEILSIIDSCAD